MLVSEALNDYRYAILRLSPQTQKEYLSKLSYFATWCEQQQPKISLDQVKQSNIRRFVEHLRTHTNPHTGQPITTSTMHGYCRVLKAFLAWCSREEDIEQLVSESTARRIEMPKVEQKVIEIFTPEQIHALFA